MEVTIEIVDYDRRTGLGFWRDEQDLIRADFLHDAVRIVGNPSGLTALARYLLTLAQSGVPSGAHIHLDDFSGLPADSVPLVLERTE